MALLAKCLTHLFAFRPNCMTGWKFVPTKLLLINSIWYYIYQREKKKAIEIVCLNKETILCLCLNKETIQCLHMGSYVLSFYNHLAVLIYLYPPSTFESHI